MVLYIAPALLHKKTGRLVRLMILWQKNRLIFKDVDTQGFSGIHILPTQKEIGGVSNTCPAIEFVSQLDNGMGWEVQGETSEGKRFILKFEHDLVEGHISRDSDPPYGTQTGDFTRDIIREGGIFGS